MPGVSFRRNWKESSTKQNDVKSFGGNLVTKAEKHLFSSWNRKQFILYEFNIKK